MFNVKAFAFAFGIFWGVFLFLIALFGVIGVDFWFFQGAFFDFYASAYPGYAVTLVGAFIGLVEGFISGFVVGYVFAWIHNTVAGRFSA